VFGGAITPRTLEVTCGGIGVEVGGSGVLVGSGVSVAVGLGVAVGVGVGGVQLMVTSSGPTLPG
jgi:hypothetical protein